MSGVLPRTRARADRRHIPLVILAAAAWLVFAGATPASAGLITTMSFQSSPTLGVGAAHGPLDVPLNMVYASGSITVYQVADNTPVTVGEASLKYSIFTNTDPVVTHNIVLTNNTAVAQDYVLTVNLPLGASSITGTTVVGGSVDVDVRDNDGNGATLSVLDANTPIYLAFTNLGDMHAMLSNIAPLVTGNYQTANTAADFGTPIPSDPGPTGTVDALSITLAFSLSAYDTATVNSNFVLEEQVIPEPASMMLIVAAGLTLVRRRTA